MNDKNDKLNDIIQKYSDVYKDKEIKFDKINIFLPNFICDIVNEGFNGVDQVRMSKGIFITSIVDDYFEYIQQLYNINPSLYEEERLKYVRQQLGITIIPETNDKIDEIKKLIGTSDRVGVVKNAIEHYIKTKDDIVLYEDILMDDD